MTWKELVEKITKLNIEENEEVIDETIQQTENEKESDTVQDKTLEQTNNEIKKLTDEIAELKKQNYALVKNKPIADTSSTVEQNILAVCGVKEK